MTFADVRPHAWDFPLFVHVGGAMVLVGAVAAAALLLAVSTRAADRAGALRLALRTLLFGAIPAYVVMRVGAEWIKSKEDVPDDLTWIGIGYPVADGSLLILIVLAILTGIAARRARRTPAAPRRLTGVSTALTLLLILAYGVAIWAMATKPA